MLCIVYLLYYVNKHQEKKKSSLLDIISNHATSPCIAVGNLSSDGVCPYIYQGIITPKQ